MGGTPLDGEQKKQASDERIEKAAEDGDRNEPKPRVVEPFSQQPVRMMNTSPKKGRTAE